MACAALQYRCLRRLAVVTTAIGLTLVAAPGRVGAQRPWPNARCYELLHGSWRIEGDTTGSRIGPPPSVPDLLILENALTEPFVPFRPRELGDTALHVVHGRSRDGQWSDGFDPSFVWWKQPHRDTLIVWFGTGFGGIDYVFAVAGDRLRGVVGTHDDRAGFPSWRAPVAGGPVRCPPAPPAIGRLRLTFADAVPPSRARGSERLLLTSEQEFDCGGRAINYEGMVTPDTVGVAVRGTFQPRGRPCASGRGPATTDLDLPRQSRRVVYVIKHEGQTNRFVLTRTDTLLSLTTERASTVVVDDGARLRRLVPAQ
jgi:hypothetical protein